MNMLQRKEKAEARRCSIGVIQLTKAQALLERFGLREWRMKLVNSNEMASRHRNASAFGVIGLCDFLPKTILIDSSMLGRQQFLQTFKHELGHALAGPRAGHGIKWLRNARKAGCSRKHLSHYQ
jgi:hypothetical protein